MITFIWLGCGGIGALSIFLIVWYKAKRKKEEQEEIEREKFRKRTEERALWRNSKPLFEWDGSNPDRISRSVPRRKPFPVTKRELVKNVDTRNDDSVMPFVLGFSAGSATSSMFAGSRDETFKAGDGTFGGGGSSQSWSDSSNSGSSSSSSSSCSSESSSSSSSDCS